MSISERDKKILVVFVGVLIFALVYLFPVRGYTEEADSFKAENETLTVRLAELEAKVAREAEIKAETANYEAKTMVMVSKFPSFLQIENEIMDLVKLEEDLKVEIPSITVNEPILAEVAAPAAVAEAAPQEANPEEVPEDAPEGTAIEPAVENAAAGKYKLYDISTSVNYKGGYANLKDFIEKIAKSSDKKSINTVSLTFDNKTGNLDGNIVYDSYYLSGSDRPYEEIITRTIKHGTKNIFGTIDTSELKKAESGE